MCVWWCVICVYVCVVCVRSICGSQCRSQFSPLLWDLEIKVRSGLAASTFPHRDISAAYESLRASFSSSVLWWWHTGFSISIEENALRGPEESVSCDSPCPCRTASPGPEQAFSAEKAKAREAYKGKRAGGEVRLASLWNQRFHLSCLEFSDCSEHEHRVM